MLKVKIKKPDQPLSGESDSASSDADKKKVEEVLLVPKNKKKKESTNTTDDIPIQNPLLINGISPSGSDNEVALT